MGLLKKGVHSNGNFRIPILYFVAHEPHLWQKEKNFLYPHWLIRKKFIAPAKFVHLYNLIKSFGEGTATATVSIDVLDIIISNISSQKFSEVAVALLMGSSGCLRDLLLYVYDPFPLRGALVCPSTEFFRFPNEHVANLFFRYLLTFVQTLTQKHPTHRLPPWLLALLSWGTMAY